MACLVVRPRISSLWVVVFPAQIVAVSLVGSSLPRLELCQLAVVTLDLPDADGVLGSGSRLLTAP